MLDSLNSKDTFLFLKLELSFMKGNSLGIKYNHYIHNYIYSWLELKT